MADKHPFDENRVRRDRIDLRDRFYEPSLRILPPVMMPDANFDRLYGQVRGRNVDGTEVHGVRHQGRWGRCAGHSLAAVIDLQRHSHDANGKAVPDIVSADMLYWMARYHEHYQEGDAGLVLPSGEGIRSLRSVLKGFYHHGVCLDHPEWREDDIRPECWRSASNGTPPAKIDGALQRFPTVEQAKAARSINLGAYYRLRPILNEYHAALYETGAILVSASIHAGWDKPVDGRIEPDQKMTGVHAFAIVGYTTDGFLVLNSWGDNWGGYEGRPGLALWTYGDWALNVLDGWVLRLGVSAPESFDISVGQHGLQSLAAPIKSGSTPCIQLLGHFMHLDDGFHVTHGAYPSFEEGWQQTRQVLSGRLKRAAKPGSGPGSDYRGIVVWLPGSFEGIRPSFTAAARRKAAIMEMGLYPYTIFWCSDFVEKSMEVLATVFETCQKQAGDDTDALATLIETSYRGVGRAFWRDIELGARRSVDGVHETPEDDDVTRPRKTPGILADFFRDLFELTAEDGAELHIVAEGAGALVLHEVLCHFQRADGLSARDIANRFTSVQLSLPAIEIPRSTRNILPLVAEMNHNRPKSDPRARIYVPSESLEQRLRFGLYNRSILHLVSRAFEDRLCPVHIDAASPLTETRHPNHPLQPPRPFLGMAEAKDQVDRSANRAPQRLKNSFYLVERLFDPAREEDRPQIIPATGTPAKTAMTNTAHFDPVEQGRLSSDPGLEQEVLAQIQRFTKGDAPPRTDS